MKKHLGVTTAVFNESLNELNNHMKAIDKNASVTRKIIDSEEMLVLNLPDDYNVFRLYANYLINCDNYRFLQFIVQRPKISISKLATEFFMSEASVFRKIKLLNSYLEEFEIQIRNNMLIGPESQIRHFTFYMRYNSMPFDDHLKNPLLYPVENFIRIMENQYHYILSDIGRVKLGIWLSITVERLKISNKDYTNIDLQKELEKVREDPLYQAIRKAALTMVNQYAIQMDDYEIFLTYKYFRCNELFSIEKGEIDILRNYLNFPDPIIQSANHNFFDTIENYYEEFWNTFDYQLFAVHFYSIKQLHNKLLFFKGSFYFFHSLSISRTLDDRTLSVVKNLTETLLEENLALLHANIAPEIKEIVYRRYFDIILQSHRLAGKRIYIGVLINKDYSVTAGVVLRLSTLFESIYNVKVEKAQADHNYDLLISDSKNRAERFNHRYFYFLNELETNFDNHRIKELLDIIYKEDYAQ